MMSSPVLNRAHAINSQRTRPAINSKMIRHERRPLPADHCPWIHKSRRQRGSPLCAGRRLIIANRKGTTPSIAPASHDDRFLDATLLFHLHWMTILITQCPNVNANLRNRKFIRGASPSPTLGCGSVQSKQTLRTLVEMHACRDWPLRNEGFSTCWTLAQSYTHDVEQTVGHTLIEYYAPPPLADWH